MKVLSAVLRTGIVDNFTSPEIAAKSGVPVGQVERLFDEWQSHIMFDENHRPDHPHDPIFILRMFSEQRIAEELTKRLAELPEIVRPPEAVLAVRYTMEMPRLDRMRAEAAKRVMKSRRAGHHR